MAGSKRTPWYYEGLAFTCTQCGDCCTGAPGYVWVTREEMRALADFRGETLDEFTTQFVRQVGRRYSLIEKPGGDCVFWNREVGCTVYEARPTQCRTWPFWSENIASRAHWEHTCKVCPGSGQGRVYTVEEIQSAAARTKT